LEESILTERWIRYYVRYFPTRKAEYRKPKMKWNKYVRMTQKKVYYDEFGLPAA